ncbi:acetate kinase, partial [candidate division FCPU426 bacterium]|nr:acetate kinase [candidate division FCPU426 bacterium]
MLILVINCGSSSLKYTLFDGDTETGSGLVERIGSQQAAYGRSIRSQAQPPLMVAIQNHEQAIRLMMDYLVA